ncbi:MAG: hypothetical protein JNK02_03280 [Planctomycetes bacterium]|nr:hypothetical protein [Planctomycetota bacterium]
MIRPPNHAPDEREAPARAPRVRGPQPAFVVAWTSGPDPALDVLVRVRALRPARDGQGLELLDVEVASRRAAPAAGAAPPEPERVDDEGAPGPEEAWGALTAFVGTLPLVVPDAEAFTAWHEHLTRTAVPTSVGLDELCALFLPGRLAGRRAGLVALLADADERAFGPEDLRRATIELARRVHALEQPALELFATAATRAWRGLADADPSAARRLGLALSILDAPSAWAPAELAGIEDGRLARFANAGESLEDLLEDARPACARELERWAALENVPADREGELDFAAEDSAVLEEVFTRHLPALFGGPDGAHGPYRRGQHETAREVARTLGSRELLLVHAPTGTGKTLAYLLPALLWARRHDVRIGVATYTRALQEQALDREVPRALAALTRAGVAPGMRVTLLKGRDNYLCWRALKSTVPEEESGEAWLAWAQLATFATTDLEGDLDRLPRRPPVQLVSSAPYMKALDALLRTVRGQSGCCTHKSDRAACGAEVARKRAEKSHVVLVNQAFALARPEFFRRLIFDECEHLHEVAHNAWSRTLSFRELRGILSRVRQPDRPGSRAVLDRLERQSLSGTPFGNALEACVVAHEELESCVDELERAALEFDVWRREELRVRPESEQHFLLREYAAHDGRGLIRARVEASHAGAELETSLADLAERLADLPVRGAPALRRALDLARTDLDEALTTIGAWLPLEEDEPRFSDAYFYDVEPEPRGGLVLAARVLLPNEVLGSSYYPELACAAFLSATTWIAGGFDAAKAYLGLDRAQRPRADEDRVGSSVRTFHAPDVFDWSRVLVAIPKDAPSVQRDKGAFLAYVRRFVAHLGERTRGRLLVLFTNASDMKLVGEELVGFFRARRIPFWFQNQAGTVKEELADLFRARVGSVLMGVDTFWYGADFPGEALEYLVIVKLPYGVPDRYHQAQCAAIGAAEQRRQIYMPKSLSKFRQGFGRLMRRETDRGCVFVLDSRALEPKHRMFLRELPVALGFDSGAEGAAGNLARLVRGDTDHCVREALRHMGLAGEAEARGLDTPFDAYDARGGAADREPFAG